MKPLFRDFRNYPLFLFTLNLSLCAFRVHAQVLLIANGGTGISAVPAITANRGWAAVNVVNYGAKGNGTTDDTAAINSAMTACVTRVAPFNGCTLYFPAGVYITTGLVLQSFVNIKGDGWGTSVIQLKPDTASDVLTVPAATLNFSIYGLTLDGNSTNGGRGNCFYIAPTATGPAEWNTANRRTASTNAQKWSHIEEVMFSNCSADGIHISAFNYMRSSTKFLLIIPLRGVHLASSQLDRQWS